jgi:hypothetical protein
MISQAISTKSPERIAAEQLVADARAVENGTRAMRDAALASISDGGNILPREAGESEQQFRSRVKTSSLDYNPYSDELARAAGGIMEHGIQLGAFEPSGISADGKTLFTDVDDVPSCIKEVWEDVDRQGTHGEVFFTKILQDAMRGVGIFMVDFWSARDERRLVESEGRAWTAEDDSRFNVRPYLVRIPLENVIYAKQGVTFRYWDNKEVYDPDAFEIKIIRRIRVIEPGRYRLAVENNGVWEWEEDSDAEGTPFVPVIPVVVLTFSPLGGEWALGAPYYQQLADATLSLFGIYSARYRAVIKAVLALYFGKRLGMKKTVLPDGNIEYSPPSANDFQHLALVASDDPDADLRIVESSGAAVAAIEKVLESCRADADRHRTSKLAETRVADASATRALIDDSDAKAPLTQVRRQLEDAIENAFRLIRDWAVLANWNADQFANRQDGGSVFIGKAPSKKTEPQPTAPKSAQEDTE